MKRRAETLIEVIIAMAVFGTVMISTFDFMANQTIAITKMRERDDIDFWAHKWLNTSRDVDIEDRLPYTVSAAERVVIEDIQRSGGKLTSMTIRKGSTHLIYNLSTK